MPASKLPHKLSPHAQRYLLTGILTIIPIWITWLLFEIVLRQLTRAGKPGVWALSRAIRDDLPILSDLLLQTWFQNVLAALITLLALYLLGWAATKVIGRRVIASFDTLIGRVPGVQAVYGAVRKLIQSFEQNSAQAAQRVVLIQFPAPGMKTLGFITRILQDQATGQELAVVYVPTAPNPTSGYLEILPLADLTVVDWTMDQAMTFVLSGGAVSPDQIDFSGKLAREADKVRAGAPEPAGR
ncbi:MAG: DUF502 domain-containing protein [Candidatus Competibacteraceae bacterium]|nr:DUF502 domain-containing protein [Candidatus Competibacteraceae bacterium]